MQKFTGVVEITLPESEIENIKKKRSTDNLFGLEISLNQYVAIKDEQGEYRYNLKFDGEKLVKLNYKKISNNVVGEIEPRNVKQEMLFDLLQNDSIPVKLVTGSMGGGKTFITVNNALHKLQHESRDFRKIVYIRNNVEVKDSVPLGALPDGIKEKLMPFIMPLQDCVGGRLPLEMMERNEQIEYVHLGHVRGRSFSNSIIIISECENLTRDHVKLLIGRVGEGSAIVFEGDESQTDKKAFEKNSGIQALREVLRGNKMFGSVELDKSERSAVAELSNLF